MNFFAVAIAAALTASSPAWAETAPTGTVVADHLISQDLAGTKTGLSTDRRLAVYLPAGYAGSQSRYPVVYFFCGFAASDPSTLADSRFKGMLDEAFADAPRREYIVVATDLSGPGIGCFFENSPVTGNWLGFFTEELVPYVDTHYRTIPQAASRGAAGIMFGGYGALKLAMLHPDVFGSVYALHPVGTGTGVVPMAARANWARMHAAKTFHDLEGDAFSSIFLCMAQAYLPDLNRPPFYCDFMVEEDGGVLKPNLANTEKLQSAFLLDHMISRYAENLKRLRAIKFDWGRYDDNPDHVFANQNFTRKLDELGIDHEAEEYRGNSWNQQWTPNGRVRRELIPFFERNLATTTPTSEDTP